MHGKDLVGQGARCPPTVSVTFRITLTQSQIGMNGRLFLPGGSTLIYYDRRARLWIIAGSHHNSHLNVSFILVGLVSNLTLGAT